MSSLRPKILLMIEGEQVQHHIVAAFENAYYGAEFTYAKNLRELELRAVYGDLAGPYDAIIASSAPHDNSLDELSEKLDWLATSGHARNNPLMIAFNFTKAGNSVTEGGVHVYSPPPRTEIIVDLLRQKIESQTVEAAI